MSNNRFLPTQRTSTTSQLGASSSASGSRPSAAAPSASRFGFRAPNAQTSTTTTTTTTTTHQHQPAATPLGKRNISNTSLPDQQPGSSSRITPLQPPSSTAKRLARAPADPSPSASPSRSHAAGPPSPSSAHQLSSLKSHYESKLLLAQQSYNDLEDTYRSLAAETERVKSSRRELVEEWEKAKLERDEEMSAWRSERESLRSEVASLRRLATQSEDTASEAQQTSARERQAWQAERTALMSRVNRLESDNLEAEELCKLEGERRQQEEKRANGLEEELNQLKSQSAGTAQQEGMRLKQENGAVEKELHRILTHSRQLEVEVSSLKASNASLRKQAEGAVVLKEENASLRKKAAQMTQIQEELARLQDHREQKKQDLDQWDRFLSSPEIVSSRIEAEAALLASNLEEGAEEPTLPPVPSPLQRSNITSYLSQLRGLVSGLLTRSTILTSKLEQSRSRTKELVGELDESRAELERLRADGSTWRSKEDEWRRARTRWDDEAARYRKLLESYEQQQQQQQAATADQSVVKTEAATSEGEDAEMADATATSSSNAAYLERIALLEQDVASKDAELARVASEHDEHSQKLKADHLSVRDELESLRSELVALQRENARLDEQLGKAEERLGLGEFDVNKYRCLVLKRNPVDMDRDLRTKTMDRIKRENEELVKKVEELSNQLTSQTQQQQQQQQRLQHSTTVTTTQTAQENAEAISSTASAVPASTISNLREEIASLHASIATKDKAMLRLKQVYSAKASEFREAVQSLFGFKVRFLENGAVRLNSTFARSSSRATSLVFRSEAGDVGRMSLAGEAANDVSLANVPHLREYWLGTGMRQSVPCFLAALQLELYESTTQAVRGAWSVPDADEDE